ncbi:MAG: copper amine oxidase N-terminal domain-containing protein [Epulopiscium sp.]|nr:copper amine oxidase N-terminal domain-containing protein [Candidatus Epulonipiscium sp.]
MKISKKLVIAPMILCMATSTAVYAEGNKIPIGQAVPISAPIMESVVDYITYKGIIKEVNIGENHFSIWVEGTEEGQISESIIFYVSDDVVLLDDSSRDFVSKNNLKEGMSISVYYGKDTIMALSMPPRMNPDVIVVNSNEDFGSVKVSKFDNELLSADRNLKLNVSDETVIVDEKGNTVDSKDIYDKDLIVFYTITTRSIPAQTPPEKIIVMDKEPMGRAGEVETIEEETALEKIVLKEVTLNVNTYKNNKNVTMIPLAKVAKALDYTVRWNGKEQSVELSRGPQWTRVVIGQDNYSFARMLIKLGTAPEIREGTTYVPFEFIKEVLKADAEILDNGQMNIKY